MMRIQKSIQVFASTAGLLVAAQSFAQAEFREFETSKRLEGPLSVISDQTGSLEYRHYVNKKIDPSDSSRTSTDEVLNQVRANFSVKTFDDIATTTFIFGAQTTNDGTQQVTQRQPQILTEVDAYSNDYVSVVPSLDIRTPMRERPTTAEIGVEPTLTHPALDVGIGSLAFSMGGEAVATLVLPRVTLMYLLS
jgi:hypothetical protein